MEFLLLHYQSIQVFLAQFFMLKIIYHGYAISIQNITENVDKKQIQGIGFDATCSLVVLGKNDYDEITASPTGRKIKTITYQLAL